MLLPVTHLSSRAMRLCTSSPALVPVCLREDVLQWAADLSRGLELRCKPPGACCAAGVSHVPSRVDFMTTLQGGFYYPEFREAIYEKRSQLPKPMQPATGRIQPKYEERPMEPQSATLSLCSGTPGVLEALGVLGITK